MSARLMGQVYDLQLDHSQQCIALALADHGHDDGTHIFPGIEYLAWKTGYSERNIIRILANLEELHLLIPVGGQTVGRGNVQEYQMVVANVPKKAPFVKGKHVKTSRIRKHDILSKGDKSDTQKVTSQHIKGDNSDTAYIEYPGAFEPPVEPPVEPERETRATKSHPSTAQANPEPRQAIPPAPPSQGMERNTPQSSAGQNTRDPIDMAGDDSDRRYHSPHYAAVLEVCALDDDLLKLDSRARAKIAMLAAGLSEKYSPELILASGVAWAQTYKTPPIPTQLLQHVSTFVATQEKTNASASNAPANGRYDVRAIRASRRARREQSGLLQRP